MDDGKKPVVDDLVKRFTERLAGKEHDRDADRKDTLLEAQESAKVLYERQKKFVELDRNFQALGMVMNYLETVPEDIWAFYFQQACIKKLDWEKAAENMRRFMKQKIRLWRKVKMMMDTQGRN